MFVKNLAYEASAGSGKTFMLVVRYLSLLFSGADPKKILALTFTNKAAHEMQERVVITLEELHERGELEVISQVTGLSKEELLHKRKQILDDFLNANTKIMTIDKFFTQILRKFSLYASLMPDFTTMSTQHEQKLLSRFLKEVSVAGKRDTLIKLSLESKKRLESIFSLLDAFYTKQKELAHLQFTKTAPYQYEEIAMQNFALLREKVLRCESASSTVLNAVEAKDFQELREKSWIGRESLEYRTFAKCFTPDMDGYLAEINEAIKNYNKAKEQNFFAALIELVDIYVKAKKALYSDDGELSFNDVSILVYYLLKERVDSEFLYFRLDAQIEHMLLDEFQDTSILQYAILKPLIDEILSGDGIFENGSFFFVGDVKQSIYRFRGGVSALFGSVQEAHETKLEALLSNYRSKKEVVDFVNSTFAQKIKNYTAQRVQEDAVGGYVKVITAESPELETLEVVKKLIMMGANLDDIAILCATNGDGEVMKQLLQEEMIEVVTETTTKLINQKSIKAVLEYLKYLYFGEDIYRYNFFSLIESAPEAINRVDLNKKKLLDIVRDAIEKYKLFYGDFHLIRFVSLLKNYSSIEALLFEYERIDASAAASDLRGVRVLTIHKSKGLEYTHVIVMDRLKKAPPSRDAIIYEYDGIHLQNVYLRMSGRETLDKEYANAILKEKTLEREDSLNALYVAFTRAKENLFIVAKMKDSMFDILEMSVCSQGKLICEQTQKQREKSFEKLEYKALYYGMQSDILELAKEEEEDLNAINFGNALHYMLEMLPSFSLEDMQGAKNALINKYGYILSEDELEDIFLRVQNLLHDKVFRELLAGEHYREKAIKYKNNLRYIDLLIKEEMQSTVSLFESGVRWKIVDYKSSMNYSGEHLKQVRYYISAIKEITGESVEGYLCYLLKDEIKVVRV